MNDENPQDKQEVGKVDKFGSPSSGENLEYMEEYGETEIEDELMLLGKNGYNRFEIDNGKARGKDCTSGCISIICKNKSLHLISTFYSVGWGAFTMLFILYYLCHYLWAEYLVFEFEVPTNNPQDEHPEPHYFIVNKRIALDDGTLKSRYIIENPNIVCQGDNFEDIGEELPADRTVNLLNSVFTKLSLCYIYLVSVLLLIFNSIVYQSKAKSTPNIFISRLKRYLQFPMSLHCLTNIISTQIMNALFPIFSISLSTDCLFSTIQIDLSTQLHLFVLVSLSLFFLTSLFIILFYFRRSTPNIDSFTLIIILLALPPFILILIIVNGINLMLIRSTPSIIICSFYILTYIGLFINLIIILFDYIYTNSSVSIYIILYIYIYIEKSEIRFIHAGYCGFSINSIVN